jgi:hypothetical protein
LIASAYAAALAHQARPADAADRPAHGDFLGKDLLPLVFTALSVGFSPRRVNDPRRPDAIANGQFLFFHARPTRPSAVTRPWQARLSKTATWPAG